MSGHHRGAPARAPAVHKPLTRFSRPWKVAIQLLVSGAVIAVLLWQIDVGQTVEVLRQSKWGYVAGSLAIFLGTTRLMAWRWGALLAARGVHEPYRWLLRMYFVANAAGQVLPTAIGADAVRIIEHARRRPEFRAPASGAVLMERILGFTAVLALVALALAMAAGRYNGARFVALLEVVFVVAVVVLSVLLFSRRLGRHFEERLFPLGRRVGLEGPLRSLYRTMHEYRNTPACSSQF